MLSDKDRDFARAEIEQQLKLIDHWKQLIHEADERRKFFMRLLAANNEQEREDR